MAVTPLIPGTPVTLVLPDHVVMVEITSSEREKFFCQLTSRNDKSIMSEHRWDAEGVTWTRGYHLADSDTVKACRAAIGLGAALKRDAEDKKSDLHEFIEAQKMARGEF